MIKQMERADFIRSRPFMMPMEAGKKKTRDELEL